MFTGRMGKIAVFCSYAREDAAIRRALERHLAPLREERLIDDWYDSHIQPGARWDDEIQRALDRSRLMLFIISPDLLSSRYVAEVEIPRGLEREQAGECRVVPILARRAEWKSSPLSRFQALPEGGRWLDAAGMDDSAYREVAAGIREACRQIVDWENPYRRAQVGDWTLQEQTITVADGRSLTGRGTEELIEKTDTRATLRLEMAMAGQVVERTITVALDQPLEDRLADTLKQTGTELPANLEISTGPASYSEERINIGGRPYETVRVRRDLTLGMRGFRQSGHVSQWRSIDVPLYGLVKGEAELPGWRQYQVLLDFGHGDAASRKPRIADPLAAPPPHGQGAPAAPAMPDGFGGPDNAAPFIPVGGGPAFPPRAPAAAQPMPAAPITPGHWVGVMDSWGTRTDFELLLHPNGGLQGRQMTMGVPSDLSGSWSYDPVRGQLALQVVTSIMGVPSGQEFLQIQMSPQGGPLLHGRDGSGRSFQFQRLG